MALGAVARGLPSPHHDHPEVSGIVIDVPSTDGFATIVALTDNTTSMYTSTGGGTIGAGEHAEVADATRLLLVEVQQHLGLIHSRDDPGFPDAGFVRFHILAPSMGRFVDVPDAAFWGREDHDLMPVIARAQNVITAMSAVSPNQT